MKIAVGHVIQKGPYGGGNSVVRSFLRLFAEAGHEVVFDLDDSDIDIIVIIDPRSRSPSISFAAGAAFRYVAFRNARTIVVHRINECDERKNGHGMNARLRLANYCADHTVFIASWLKELAVWRGGSHSTILNGGDNSVFHDNGYAPWSGGASLKLITHHWGGNWMKGFDVYEKLDRMLGEEPWKERLQFTYIGNTPPDFVFRNARYLAPLNGEALADELRAHHVYVTGSINEPAGLHHIEGALCGLPILYRRSGGLPEYCEGYGIAFDGPADLEAALERVMAEYETWRASLEEYGHVEERMVGEYLALFEGLLARRDEIAARRRPWRNPWLVLLNQLPL